VLLISQKNRILVLVFFLFLCVSGCAGITPGRGTGYESSNVFIDVPFVKQEKNYCGPAALSSVFAFWGVSRSQEEIAGHVFEPDLSGSLNISLEQYAKENGFWAKGYRADLAILAERLRAGIPLIVMERLHPFILRRNHFSVVAGFDEKNKLIIEHTGAKAGVRRSVRGFLRNWQAAGMWMLEIMPLEKAGTILLNNEDKVELGVLLEKQGEWESALRRYQSVSEASRHTPLVLFNIGNVYSRLQVWDKAIASYREALNLDDSFADCYNNLACAYLRQNNYAPAHAAVDKALAMESNHRFYYLDTKAQIFFAEHNDAAALKCVQEAENYLGGIPPEAVRSFHELWDGKFGAVDASGTDCRR